ncbi:Choline/ethanolamine kinase [Cryptotermes secundus]|uniref:Choline/ethanolamine kinase n=1 Tax=Cryptotermes secundus TaxID=105785 RepID=A0A2J7PZV9_9NEOP|nr:choline/ethanolamine kinase isoform X2 [Cryptotermes secundus]PNF21862.1 Choline/ethanolamine kinase [Cryptotermes secundus]
MNTVLFYNLMASDSVEMREMAARICRDYLHGSWRKITTRDIVLKRISGGLSNWLYHVSLPETRPPKSSEPSQVLLRLYGQVHGAERALEGLITESVIFTLLSERRLGPKLHGVFPGGRIEEYIPARPLKTKELGGPQLSVLIAEKMANIHKMNVPINKEPRWLWDTISGWVKNVQANLEDPGLVESENVIMLQKLKMYNLAAEAEWLRKYLGKISSPVVFCHNDMQEGNILLCTDNMTDDEALMNPRLVLIDFEYCSYNYRGFDLANHFLEWMYDYTKSTHPYFTVNKNNYPRREQQLLFVRTYLHNAGCQGERATERDEEALLCEVQAFSLASHLFWGLWSAVNAKLSQIPFGYWEYAIERLESYFQLKNKILNTTVISNGTEIGVKRKIQELDS